MADTVPRIMEPPQLTSNNSKDREKSHIDLKMRNSVDFKKMNIEHGKKRSGTIDVEHTNFSNTQANFSLHINREAKFDEYELFTKTN